MWLLCDEGIIPKCQDIENSHNTQFSYLLCVGKPNTQNENENENQSSGKQDPQLAANIRRMRCLLAAAGCQCDFVNVIRHNDNNNNDENDGKNTFHISYFTSRTVLPLSVFGETCRQCRRCYSYRTISHSEFRAQNAKHKWTSHDYRHIYNI